MSNLNLTFRQFVEFAADSDSDKVVVYNEALNIVENGNLSGVEIITTYMLAGDAAMSLKDYERAIQCLQISYDMIKQTYTTLNGTSVTSDLTYMLGKSYFAVGGAEVNLEKIKLGKKYYLECLNTQGINSERAVEVRDGIKIAEGVISELENNSKKANQTQTLTQSQNTPENKSSGGCYIATACYGDYNAPQVLTFRQFRDNSLLTNFLGKIFVKFYYRYSPYWAEKLKTKRIINNFVKTVFLDPLYKLLK